jgi:hypothetical protein
MRRKELFARYGFSVSTATVANAQSPIAAAEKKLPARRTRIHEIQKFLRDAALNRPLTKHLPIKINV